MNILITGASKGIGKELALEFARRNAGKLFLLARSEEQLQIVSTACKEINPTLEVILVPFDITRIVQNGNTFPVDFQHLDILINNAGYLIRKSFSEITVDEVDKIMKVNFLAPAQLIKNLLPKMGGNTFSHVVNISSMGGFQGSSKFSGLSYYSASKAALASLTECLAEEFSNNNIYFNCLALGSVQTEMLEEAFPGYKAPVSSKEMAAFICDFALNGYKFFNGKILPVSLSTP